MVSFVRHWRLFELEAVVGRVGGEHAPKHRLSKPVHPFLHTAPGTKPRGLTGTVALPSSANQSAPSCTLLDHSPPLPAHCSTTVRPLL